MARVLLRYLIVKLKILAGSLLCARDQSELRVFFFFFFFLGSEQEGMK